MFNIVVSVVVWIALFSLIGFGIYKLILSVKDKKNKKEKEGEEVDNLDRSNNSSDN